MSRKCKFHVVEKVDFSDVSRKKLVDTWCVVSRLCRPTALDGALGVPEDGDGFTPPRTTRKKRSMM